jgi:hypothetical protein
MSAVALAMEDDPCHRPSTILAQGIGVGHDDLLKKPAKTPTTMLMFNDLI